MEQRDLLVDRDIDRLFYTTADMIYETDMQHGDGRNYWPFHPVLLDSIVATFVFDELYRLFTLLEKNGNSVAEIARLIKSPTRLANYQFLWSGGAKTIKHIPVQKKYYLASMFTKILRILRNNQPFCENFVNPMLSERELQSVLTKNTMHIFQDKKAKNILAKLEGLLMSYSELLYYYMLDFSRMFHGPYVVNNKHIFIKEFLDLQADDMWDKVAGFPFNDFREIGYYDAKMNIQVFFMGHTHTYPSYPEALESFILELDNKPVQSLAELEQYYNIVDQVVSKAVASMTAKKDDQEFLLKRGIDLFFYPLKALYQAVGESWQKKLPEVYAFARTYIAEIPPPWGNYKRTEAIRFLMKQMEFRE